MNILVAIPCLNEDVAVGSVVLKARRHVAAVLVVDDGSDDKTADVAALAGAQVIRHDRNRGKGAAYDTLWKAARDGRYDALVVLDGDGQHDADEIPMLVAKLQEADVVIGARWGERTQMPWWRRIGKRILDYGTALGSAKSSSVRLTDSQSGFRAYSARALQGILPRDAGFGVESQLLMEAHDRGLRIEEVPITCRYDVDGSSMGAVRHASGVLNSILIQVGMRHPLLFLGVPGVAAVAVALGLGAFAIWLYEVRGIFAPGWVFLSTTLLVVGVLCMVAGLIFNILPRSVQEALRRSGLR